MATRHRATLVDLLDRGLDRGLVINADVVISLAGVPLVGTQLRAALAGVETMIRYGVMEDWARGGHAGEMTLDGVSSASLRDEDAASAVALPGAEYRRAER